MLLKEMQEILKNGKYVVSLCTHCLKLFPYKINLKLIGSKLFAMVIQRMISTQKLNEINLISTRFFTSREDFPQWLENLAILCK